VTELLTENDCNIDILKLKLKYVTKKQTDIVRRISKSIADESKVFHRYFDTVRKIDEQMIKNRNTKPSPKLSFPQLMSQIQRKEKGRKHSITCVRDW
jgi:hypothetical protein